MRLILCCSFAILSFSDALAQTTTRLVGQVSNDENQPIASVAATLNGVTVITDSRGRFAFSSVPSGQQIIRFELIGYAPRTDTIAIAEGVTTDITVRISKRPVTLPPVEVKVRPRWLETNGYFERRFQSGLSGHFIDRAEIERRNPSFLTDLLIKASGVRLEQNGGRRVIRFNREAMGGLTPRQPPPDPFERWLVAMRGCQPTVFIDGRVHHDRMISGHGPFIDDFNMLTPAVIDAIEIYVGTNSPPEYRSPNGCGVILLWTRK